MAEAKYEARLYADILKTNPCFEYPLTQRIETEKGQILYAIVLQTES